MHPNQSPPRRDALFVAGLHVAVALASWTLAGVTILWDTNPDHWGWFYQNIDTDLLREHPFQSIWYSHAQPPIWNALGALLLAVFGGWHMQALQCLQVVLGAATAAMCTQLVRTATGRRGPALATGVLVALHPAMLLYEAYALYTLLAAFLVTLAALALSRVRERPSGGAVLGFFATLSALVLTRSVFHLALLVLALPFSLLLLGRPTRRQLSILTLLFLLPTGWYAKNLVQHGFFGASSWYGMGFWRIVLFAQEPPLLDELYRAGLFSPVVSIVPFSAPSMYRGLGFDAVSDVAVLAQDDLGNVNIPAISRAYQQSAHALLRRAAGRYARNVLVAYGNFASPSGDFRHLEANRVRLGLLGRIEGWVLARPAVGWIERKSGAGYFGSLYLLLIPTVVLLGSWQSIRGLTGPEAGHERLRREAAPIFMAGIVAYTTLVSCTMELGENLRFKFMIEPVFLALTAIVLVRSWPKKKKGSASVVVAADP